MDTDPKDTPFDGTTSRIKTDVVVQDKRSSRIINGVLLIALGAIFLVDRMGWQWGWHVPFSHLWPVLLIVAGIGTALTDRETEVAVRREVDGQPQTELVMKKQRRFGDGFFLTLVGVLLLMHVNRWVSLAESWPLFVVAAGLGMIFGRDRASRRRARREGR